MYLLSLYPSYSSTCYSPMSIFDSGNDRGEIARARKKTRRAKYYRRYR